MCLVTEKTADGDDDKPRVVTALAYLLLLQIILLTPGTAWAAPLTLEECYRLALVQSESVQRSSEQVTAAQARYEQALAALLPKVDLFASERFRNSTAFGSTSRSNVTEDSSGVTVRGGREKEQFESYFSVTQPLFKGFRDRLLAEAAELNINAARYSELRTRELLYRQVAESFYQLTLYRDDLAILKRVSQVLNDRIKELNGFIDLGKSRASEVLSAQSELANVRALIERTRGLERASAELLGFFIGRGAEQIELPQFKSVKETPKPLDEYLTVAAERPDIQAARELRQAAALERDAVRRENWPTVDLQGNVYPYDDPDLNREWEILFRFSVPIFEGGLIDARAAERAAAMRIQELNVREAARVAEREVRTAYSELTAAMAEALALALLYDASIKNLEAQRADYELGVVTNLDVLEAIRQSQDARRRLLSAEVAVALSRARLIAASGEGI